MKTAIQSRLTELKDILIPFLFPWPTRRDNTIMWVKMSLMWFLVWRTFGLCWGLLTALAVSNEAMIPRTLIASAVLLLMSGYCTLAIVGDQVVKATTLKNEKMQDEILKRYHDRISKIRDTVFEGIQKAAGREVKMNPISTTAATIEIVERMEREEAAKNPLEAALNEDAESFDELMHDDDQNEKF